MRHLIEAGLELTFFPNKPGLYKEYLGLAEATEAAKVLNKAIADHPDIQQWQRLEGWTTPLFTAEAAIFRSKLVNPDQPHDAWGIEVHNHPVRLWTLKGWHMMDEAIDALYAIMDQHGLVPYLEEVAPDGSLLDWPTGGGHIHVSQMGLWDNSSDASLAHALLDRTLALDYANYPFMRWLFSQWSDNTNSQCSITAAVIKAVRKEERKGVTMSPAKWSTLAHDMASENLGIRNRLMVNGAKSCLPTWELRWFDMPRNRAELSLQASFVDAWISDRVDRITNAMLTDHGPGDKGARIKDRLWRAFNRDVYRVKMTTRHWNRLTKDPVYAEAQTRAFLKSLDLDPDPFIKTFWERGYLRRFHYGVLT